MEERDIRPVDETVHRIAVGDVARHDGNAIIQGSRAPLRRHRVEMQPRLLHHFSHIDVMYRVVVRAKAEITACRCEVSRAQRYGTSLTLLMIDVDNLKHINDRAGHSAGDRALQQVAGVLRAGVRDSDQVFRYAGDEFAVLLVGGDAATAREVAERLRSRVAGLPADAEPARPTLSIGLAPLRATDSGQALFERADSALYGAKQAGRNCVCSAE